MAKNTFQLNYDEMTAIAKKFKDEGEDIVRLHATTRQKVRDLYKEWVGEGADKFFDEMETKLLPAVQRLSQALFLSQDATNEIMKIIQSADEETAGFFRNQLSGDDFGASRFGAALQGLQGGLPASDDFGAGKFGEALGSPLGGSSSDDFGAGKFGEALEGDSSNTSQDSGGPDENKSGGGGNSSEKNQKDKETPAAETEPTSGGGGGGGSSSQGLQGDLKNMGVGLGGMTPQNASSGGGASVNMPDHVYSSGSDPSKPDDAPKPSGNESKPGIDTGSGDSSQSSSAGIASAAAAAGGAAKVIKKKKKGS